MGPHSDLAHLLRTSSRGNVSQWHQPLEIARHSDRLRQLIPTACRVYPNSFSYPEPTTARQRLDLLSEAESILPTIRHQGLQELVGNHISKARRSTELAVDRDDDDYTRAQVEHLGLPSAATMAMAAEILAVLPPADHPTPTVSSERLLAMITAAIANYALEGWTAELDSNLAAKVSIAPTLRRIRVRSNIYLTVRQAKRLLAHEVGGHVLRTANSALQPEPLAVIPLGRTVATEEGLALVVEQTFGLGDDQQQRTYALRSVAVHEAQTGGILDVARHLTNWTSLDEATEIAMRVKRGLQDPNRPGGATKDFAYLEGFLLLASTPDSTRDLLGSVKWGQENLSVVADLHASGGLYPVRYRPDAGLLGVL